MTADNKQRAREWWKKLVSAGVRYPGNGEAVFLAAINEAEARGRRAGLQEAAGLADNWGEHGNTIRRELLEKEE